ncbi:tetratricopeptide repeat protein [Mycolicibacterium vinylchloridicum]|uniref:hypothetical protein n=1 Tax=Mycolicibacterium vinylchloridicum TaxID=2736928 RepID=UPI0015CD2C45|nr:hypothetical protein [Mycolicibacterium vinylchloridicum]
MDAPGVTAPLSLSKNGPQVAATRNAALAPPPVPVQPPGDFVQQASSLIDAARRADAAGNATAARTSIQQAEQILRQHSSAQPSAPDYQLALARVLEVTSEIEVDKNLRRAAATAEEAVRIRLALIDSHPDNIDYLLALGVAYNNLGTVALAHNDPAEAIRWMQVSCQVFRDAVDMAPSSTGAQQYLGTGAFRLGQIAAADDQNALALAAFEQSAKARSHLTLSPSDHEAWHGLGEALAGLCDAHAEMGDDSAALRVAQEAVAAFRSAVVGHDDLQGHRDLALALVKGAACAANAGDAHALANQALEAGRIWQRYGTDESGRRWPIIAQLLTDAAAAVQHQDAELAKACQRGAYEMS